MPQLDDPGTPPVRTLLLITTAAIFVQLILGAGFRHGAFGIVPHMIGAVVVLFLVVWTGRTVRNRFRSVRDLRRWGILLQAFLGTQILLGRGCILGRSSGNQGGAAEHDLRDPYGGARSGRRVDARRQRTAHSGKLSVDSRRCHEGACRNIRNRQIRRRKLEGIKPVDTQR